MFEKINQFRNAPERTTLTLTFSESISVGKQGGSGNSQSGNIASRSAQGGYSGGQGSQGGDGSSQGATAQNGASAGSESTQNESNASQGSKGSGGGNGAQAGAQGSSSCGCSSGGTSGSIQCSHTLKVRLCDAIAVMLGAKIIFTSLIMLKCKLGK